MLGKWSDKRNSKRFMIDINDELVKTGQVVHYSKGMQTAIDENGTKFRADLND